MLIVGFLDNGERIGPSNGPLNASVLPVLVDLLCAGTCGAKIVTAATVTVCGSMVLDVVHFDVAVFSCIRIQCHDHVIISKKVYNPFYLDIMIYLFSFKEKRVDIIFNLICVYFVYFMILINHIMACHIISSYIHGCPYIFQLWTW